MALRRAESMGTEGSIWQHAGYSGCGNVEGLLGSSTDRPAIIAGNASGVFEEVEEVLGIVPNSLIYAVNDVGMFLPRVDHWVSLHADFLPRWMDVRNQHHASAPMRTHSHDPKPAVDYAWEGLSPLFALSGYFAMQIAWLMGCRPIILCGCPGSRMPRFFEAQPRTVVDGFGYGGGMTRQDEGIAKQLVSEMNRLPNFKAAVRSMSGWTWELFGGIE